MTNIKLYSHGVSDFDKNYHSPSCDEPSMMYSLANQTVTTVLPPEGVASAYR